MRRAWAACAIAVWGLAACGGDGNTETTSGSGGTSTGVGGEGGGGAASAVGAQLTCPDGELDEGGTCLAPGVPADGCAPGFTHADGACSAIMPSAPCGPGSHALPGDTVCRPVADCASGTWGDIGVDATTTYVDASFGGAGNGSANAPFTTLQQALAAAPAGGIIAVAAGTYDGPFTLTQDQHLWGACPDQVTLTASGDHTLVVIAGASVVAESLALTGSDVGAAAYDSELTLRRVRVHDTGAPGAVSSGSSAQLVLESSLLENVAEYGIFASGGNVEIVDSTIRDVLPNGSGHYGEGLFALVHNAEPGTIVMRRSVIERVVSHALSLGGVTATVVEDSLIRDVTLPPVGGNGAALWQVWMDGDGERATLDVSGTVIERVVATGIGVYGGDATIDRVTVRDVTAPTTFGEWGGGIRVFSNGEGTMATPTAVITGTTVHQAHRVGVELWAAQAELERVLVTDVRAKTTGDHGFGVIAFDHDVTLERSELTYRGGRIERARQGGLVISGSTATIDSVAVIDTLPTGMDSLGVGVSVLTDDQTSVAADATMDRVVVDGAHAGGIVVGGGDLVLRDPVVRNIDKQLNVDDFGDGIGAAATVIWIPDILPTTMSVSRATVEGVPRAGVSNFGATVTIDGSWLDCNGIDLDGEELDGAGFTFEDAGGNDCGCGEERVDCKVLSTNIGPPFSL